MRLRALAWDQVPLVMQRPPDGGSSVEAVETPTVPALAGNAKAVVSFVVLASSSQHIRKRLHTGRRAGNRIEQSGHRWNRPHTDSAVADAARRPVPIVHRLYVCGQSVADAKHSLALSSRELYAPCRDHSRLPVDAAVTSGDEVAVQ